MTIIIDTGLEGEIDSWATLLAYISEETDGRAPQDQLAAYVRRAEARIRRAFAIKPAAPMQTSAPVAITSETYSAPVGIVRPYALELTGACGRFEVDYLDPETFSGIRCSQPVPDKPRYFTMVDKTLRFWPAPVGSHSGTLYYYSELPALSINNQQNWLLKSHPDVYLDGSLYYAYRAMPDIEKATLLKGVFEDSLSEALEAYPTPESRSEMATDIPSFWPDGNSY